MSSTSRRISVVGLGYVGLPVAMAFGKSEKTIGFDINQHRVSELQAGYDRNGEVSKDDLENSKVEFTSSSETLSEADFHIVAVPTPIDSAHQPNLRPLLSATETVGKILKPGDIVVFESTVYPGVTEDECVPILERASGLKGGVDFKVGYSPERINPGDTEHSFTKITKVVSGQDEESLSIVASVYGSVVTAGVFKASSIKVAEAAKVIENTQRDLNIALMNELSIIFGKIGVDTQEVLDAAGTKWNFLKFYPGLVGGHCIGVDPYYLTHLAEKIEYHPQVILAGRRINDSMGKFVAQKTIKEMIKAGHSILGSMVTVLGLSFKENCPDLRNSRVMDIVNELRDYGVGVQACDPRAHAEEVEQQFNLKLRPIDDLAPANAVILAVSHNEFKELGISQIKSLMRGAPVLIDVKGMISPKDAQREGIRLWRL